MVSMYPWWEKKTLLRYFSGERRRSWPVALREVHLPCAGLPLNTYVAEDGGQQISERTTRTGARSNADLSLF